jgi:hypothetical protein
MKLKMKKSKKSAKVKAPLAIKSKDPDIRGSWPALLRASRRAFARAKATHTPFYVVRKGRIVNLNPKGKLRKQPVKVALI